MFKTIEEFPLHHLFSKDLRIQIKILTLLYQNNSGFTIDDLTDEIGLYRKTIYKYIQQINQLSKKILQNTIIYSVGGSYTFIGDKIDFLRLKTSLLETCTSVKLFKLLLTQTSTNVYKFCLDNFISESTLKRNIQIMNDFLFDYKINVKIRKNEIYLTGDEAKIRYFFITIFWRTYNGIKWPFDILKKEDIDAIISTSNCDELKSFSPGKKSILTYVLAINIIRAKSNHPISLKSFPKYTQLLINTTKLNYFPKQLRTYFNLSPEEVDFILITLFIFPEFHIENNEITKILETMQHSVPESYNSIIRYLEFVRNKHKNWDNDSDMERLFLASVISDRIAVDIFKEVYFNIQDVNLITCTSQNYPKLLPSIASVIKNHNPNLSVGLLKSLTFRFAQTYLLASLPKDFEPKIKVLIISDIPLSVERWMILRIESLLRSKYNIIIRTNQKRVSRPDLIISTAFYDGMDMNTPIVFVSPEINSRDTNNILTMCDILSKRYQRNSSSHTTINNLNTAYNIRKTYD